MADLATDGRRLTTGPAVRYRVATIGHAPDALWEVHGAEFAHKALAEEWAHYLLWTAAPDRPRHATLVRIVDGQVQIPRLMEGRMREERGLVARRRRSGAARGYHRRAPTRV